MQEIRTITFLKNHPQLPKFIQQVEDIFFISSSVKSFDSEQRRSDFFNRWCGSYLSLFPDDFYLMIDEDQVLGYLCGCKNTMDSLSVLDIPGLNLFSKEFLNFPAHFHINFNSNQRGKGLGSQMVNQFFQDCTQQGIAGVHIITSPDALNVNFYKKLGFVNNIEKRFNGNALFFMGASLS